MLSKRKDSSDGETRTRLDASQDSKLRNKNNGEKFTSNRRTRSKSNDRYTSERQSEKTDTTKQRVNEETDRNKDYSSARRSNNNERERERDRDRDRGDYYDRRDDRDRSGRDRDRYNDNNRDKRSNRFVFNFNLLKKNYLFLCLIINFYL